MPPRSSHRRRHKAKTETETHFTAVRQHVRRGLAALRRCTEACTDECVRKVNPSATCASTPTVPSRSRARATWRAWRTPRAKVSGQTSAVWALLPRSASEGGAAVRAVRRRRAAGSAARAHRRPGDPDSMVPSRARQTLCPGSAPPASVVATAPSRALRVERRRASADTAEVVSVRRLDDLR